MSLFCYGVYVSGQDNMIFSKLAKWSKDNMGVIHKPLFGCIYCMASIWGTVSYSIIQLALSEAFNPFEWIVCCVICISLNKFVYNNLESE